MTRLPSSVQAKLEEWEREGRSGEVTAVFYYLNGQVEHVDTMERQRHKVERAKSAPRLME